MTTSMKCCLCGEPIDIHPISGWAEGHNAEPVVANGRCCTDCNDMVVIPTRLSRLASQSQKLHAILKEKTEMTEQTPTPPTPPAKPKREKPKSRPKRWAEAASDASNALSELESALEHFTVAMQELRSVQEEYEEWKYNQPESLTGSPLGEKLEAICELDIENASEQLQVAIDEARGIIDEAEGMDLPMGFGRD